VIVRGYAGVPPPHPVQLDTVIAGEPDNPPDVPVVFWLKVGHTQLEQLVHVQVPVGV
jgi:hypothetical protein